MLTSSLIYQQCQLLLIIMILTGFALPAKAAQVEGLYDVAVPVASQSNKDLRLAEKQGLATVFVRVTGSAEVVKQVAIAKAVKQANKYTRQFQYEDYIDPLTNEESLRVVIEFEAELVDQQLRLAGLPMWSSNRPTVLLWMVVEDASGRRFVSAEQDPDIVKAIIENANRRGLAIKLPVLDLKDMVAVTPDKLWQLNSWDMEAAIERYQPDTFLLGRAARLSNGELLGKWLYSYNLQQLDMDGDAANADRYIAMAINQIAESLSEQYAIAPVKMADNGVLMRLSGIDSFVTYARAINYLESVAAISHANVVYIDGDEIIVRLVADGELSQLQQSFDLDKRLQPQLQASPRQDYLIVLDYSWPTS